MRQPKPDNMMQVTWPKGKSAYNVKCFQKLRLQNQRVIDAGHWCVAGEM